jgi:hypothetical protein
MVDGGVRNISRDIDGRVFQALATREGQDRFIAGAEESRWWKC